QRGGGGGRGGRGEGGGWGAGARADPAQRAGPVAQPGQGGPGQQRVQQPRRRPPVRRAGGAGQGGRDRAQRRPDRHRAGPVQGVVLLGPIPGLVPQAGGVVEAVVGRRVLITRGGQDLPPAPLAPAAGVQVAVILAA